MKVLDKLALPRCNEKMLDELYHCKSSYDSIDGLIDTKVDKEQSKKKILTVAFESISSLFDLSYEQKLKFIFDHSDDSVYIDISNKGFNEILYNIYCGCFYKYLNKIHTFKNNKIDDSSYCIMKLAYLNKGNEVITKIINKSYLELFKDTSFLFEDIKNEHISKSELDELIKRNNLRNKEIVNTVKEYSFKDDLNSVAIKEVYKCFSDDIFSNLSKKEKIHVCNLLYNYFVMGNKCDLCKKYDKLIANKNNKECLSMVIDDLVIPSRTMIAIKRNNDLIKDVLSGLTIIYNNEIKKENVNSLDCLYSKININKRS